MYMLWNVMHYSKCFINLTLISASRNNFRIYAAALAEWLALRTNIRMARVRVLVRITPTFIENSYFLFRLCTKCLDLLVYFWQDIKAPHNKAIRRSEAVRLFLAVWSQLQISIEISAWSGFIQISFI